MNKKEQETVAKRQKIKIKLFKTITIANATTVKI